MKKSIIFSSIMISALLISCGDPTLRINYNQNFNPDSNPEFDPDDGNIITYTKYSKSTELYGLVNEGYNKGKKGPIIVQKGKLYSVDESESETETDIYLITLSGTEDVKNQSTGYWTDLQSGFNGNSTYLENVIKVIKENIPEGSNLVLSGHSLGGMISQQVSADDDIKEKYEVLNVVTFGSPLLAEGSREGSLKRLCDISDIVPLASGSTFNNSEKQWNDREVEDGGYDEAINNGTDLSLHLVGAANDQRDVTGPHCYSYARDDVWGEYDTLGFKGGKSYIVVEDNSKTFYENKVNKDKPVGDDDTEDGDGSNPEE